VAAAAAAAEVAAAAAAAAEVSEVAAFVIPPGKLSSPITISLSQMAERCRKTLQLV
jgi:hypothetical protein